MAFDARPLDRLTETNAAQDELSATQLEFFQRRLLEMRRERVARCEQSRRDLAAQDPAHDPNDQASLEERWRLEMSLRERDDRELREIDAALRRIATGDYGWCERTGEPIGVARLRANPIARTVVRKAS